MNTVEANHSDNRGWNYGITVVGEEVDGILSNPGRICKL